MTDDELLGHLADALDVPVPPVDDLRRTAIRVAATSGATAGGVDRSPASAAAGSILTSRRALLFGGAAAAGVIGGSAIATATSDESTETADPPTEAITWSSQPIAPTDTLVAGRLINHTWGVEVLFDATGFAPGAAYRVTYRSTAGVVVEAGGFVGAGQPVHCRCNGPLLRPDLSAIEISTEADGVLWRADLGAPARTPGGAGT